MKTKLLAFIISISATITCWSQSENKAIELLKLYSRASEINISTDIKDAIFIEVNNSELINIRSEKKSSIKLELPLSNNEKIIFNLHTVKVVSDNFSVITGNNEKVAYTPGLYYQGTVEGSKEVSIAAWSFFENSLMGVFSFNGENYVLGLWQDSSNTHNNIYILYKDSNVLFQRDFECSVDDNEHLPATNKSLAPENPEQLFTNCIKIYFECDYKMYVDKGSSTTNVSNFVTGMFNSVQAIYTAENIGMEISQIYVWTSTDPYITDTTSSTVLTKFRLTRTTFNGNLAHLLSTRNSNLGGRAYIDVLCANTGNSHAFTNIDNTYNAYPSYSWTVYAVTHEIGHNLGSRHTHWCGWTGGPIDNCAPAENGPCNAGPNPNSGGTIMSYCHQTNAGIYFTNGFGTQPGNLIRSKYNAATCLSACTPPPAPPANDDCLSATLLTSSPSCSPITGTTLNATSTGNDSCSGPLYADVWYKFVAQETEHLVKIQGTGGFDPWLEVKNSPSCSGSSIICFDTSGANGIEAWDLDNLVVGATYMVRVHHIGTGALGGSFTICVTHTSSTPGPNNNNCGTPITLTSSITCNPVNGSTANATQSIPGTCTGTSDDDVWFNFIAQATNHTVNVQGAVGFDAVVDIRSNTSCSGTNIVCSDATGSGGIENVNLTGLTIGTNYLIRVYHYATGSGSGTFDICVTHSVPPAQPNDNCSSAISIPSSTTCNYTSGSTTGATQSIAGTCMGNGDDDVWYSFTATAAEHIVTVLGGTGFDPVIDVRTGTCNGTNLSCTDATGTAGTETATLSGLTIGTTYLIRVYHFGTGAGGGNFQICVTHTVPNAPANDICTYATVLTSSTACNYTNGTTTGATQSISGTCNGTGDDDVWYSFVATTSNHTVQVQSAQGFDAVVDIRTSNTCSGTNIICSDNSGGSGLETVNLTGLTIGTTYMVRVYHYNAGAGSGNFQICVTHTIQTCTYSISPTNLSYTSTGGTGTITLNSGNNCNWTAVTQDNWITITSGNSGTGNGTINYSVANNSGSAQRTGIITIGGQTHTVAQSGNTPCTFTVSPLNQTYTASATTGTISITTSNNCNWLATSNAGWITITSNNSGTGNSTITYSITSNNTTSQRVGTITIAGQVYTVTQSGTIPCSYTTSPTNMSYVASGGTGTINISTTAGCNWTANTTDNWILITSGNSGSGNGTVSYSVASNTGTTQRTGSITIGGQIHTVAQSGNTSCTFTIAPLNQTFSDPSATGTVTVTTSSGCNWAATSNDSWITVTAGNTGSGNSTVSYSITSNTSTLQRVGTITIAGQVHSITQSGVAPCSYTISPASLSFNASGGSGSINVNTASGCQWLATTNDNWINITSNNSGSGIGIINYSILNNTTTSQRTGTITIAGQIHTIIQSGLQCLYTISPTASSHPFTSDAGSFNINSANGCNWTAVTTDNWITIGAATGSGNGNVTYTITANTNTTQRLGIISVAGQTFTVVQNGTSSCSYSINPSNQTLTSTLETGSFNVTTISGCSWTAISNDSWISITSGNNGSGNGTVHFTCQENTSTTQRVGTITVGGQICTITQSGIICPSIPVVQNTGCSLIASLLSNVSYQWFISGTPIQEGNSQFYTANQPGFYSVYVTDTLSGCTSHSEPEYVSCSGVGVEELNLANAIVLYPNPSSGVFNIKSVGVFGKEKVKISIINVYGQLVYSTYTTPVNGEINLIIDKPNPAKGTYTVSFTFDNVEINKKLIIK
jgi:hypothetical protein